MRSRRIVSVVTPYLRARSATSTVPVRNEYLSWLGNGKIFYVPVPVVVTILVVGLMHYVLSQTRFGQYTYAIGGNREAAVRAARAIEINING